jgi:hypothetical protein
MASWNAKSFIAAAILFVGHVICLILFIAGWASSNRLEDPGYEPNRFYFVWGLLIGIIDGLVLVLAGIVPHIQVRRVALLLLIFFTFLLMFPLTNVLDIGVGYTTYSDCSQYPGGEERCNGGKLIFVSTFFWMFIMAGEIVYAAFFYHQETAEAGTSGFSRV